MKTLRHEFVEFIPDELKEGVLYITITYCTATHKCVCGCGNEVVTPISPTDWQLSFNGEAVSLSPSIGNWEFDCQSHYWIKKNRVEHAGKWSAREIDHGRQLDNRHKERHFTNEASNLTPQQPGWLDRFRKMLDAILRMLFGKD